MVHKWATFGFGRRPMTTITDRLITSTTLSISCWCEPRTALDGHRNDDGAPPDFHASADDPVDAAGWLIEVIV